MAIPAVIAGLGARAGAGGLMARVGSGGLMARAGQFAGFNAAGNLLSGGGSGGSGMATGPETTNPWDMDVGSDSADML